MSESEAVVSDELADVFANLPVDAAMCTVGRVLNEASDAGRSNLQAFLDAKHVTHREIIDGLHAVGVPVSKETVSAHRRRSCRCYR